MYPVLELRLSLGLLGSMTGLLVLAFGTARGAEVTWNVATGPGGYWSDPVNWGGVLPLDGDALFFSGTNGLWSTNNFVSTNSYASLTFNAGSGPFTLRGTPVFLTGGLTNSSPRIQTNNLSLYFTNLDLTVTNGSLLVLNGGVYSTNGSLTKYGRGTVLLNGPNACAGGVAVRRGAVKTVNSDRLGPPGVGLVLDGGGLGAGGTVILNNRTVTLGPRGGTLDVDPLGVLTVNKPLVGTGTLAKVGAGTLVLGGGVVSSGAVALNAGLTLAAGLVNGPSNLTVYAGATLGGSGAILCDTLVADGGILAPGTNNAGGPATLTVSNLSLSANSILRFELNSPGVLGGTNDLLIVHGNLVLDGIIKVSGTGTNGLYPIIKYDGSLVDHGVVLGPAVEGSLIVDTTNQIVWINAVSFPAAPPAPLRLLFVGNSLTMYHELPATVAAMANAAGDWFAYGTELAAGMTLTWHDTNGLATNMIDTGNYDLMMLQEYSSRPSFPLERDTLMLSAATDLNSHVTNHGGRTIFYQTWGYPGGDPAHCASYDTPPQYQGCDRDAMLVATRYGYTRIASALNAAISPVGQAWYAVQHGGFPINLYSGLPGDYHPGNEGTYLAACVHYAAIFGRSPVGNPAIGYLTDTNVAAYLQNVAEQTVLQDPFAVDAFGFSDNRYYWACAWPNFTNRVNSRLSGMLISGAGGLPSPSVKLDLDAGQTNNVYLGVFGNNYELAGQGRLFIAPGASLVVTGTMVVGKEGQGWVSQTGGRLEIDGPLTIAEQPLSTGSYILTGGSLSANLIQAGLGGALFVLDGGVLDVPQFGAATNSFDLVHSSGILNVSNSCAVFGNYVMSNTARVEFELGSNAPTLSVRGTASLAGVLNVRFAPGFQPAAGQSFTVMSAGNLTGRFDQVITPWPFPGGFATTISYTNNSVVATMLDATADSNTNGLPDWWELQYFGSIDSGQTWTNSYLGDGIPNGVKYAFLIDPTVPVPPGLLPHGYATNGYFMLVYRQHRGGVGTVGVDYTADYLTYTVWLSTSLLPPAWTTGSGAVQWTGSRVDNGDGSETVSVRSVNPLDVIPGQYLRLNISFKP